MSKDTRDQNPNDPASIVAELLPDGDKPSYEQLAIDFRNANHFWSETARIEREQRTRANVAEARITELQAEVERLREALEPFAEAASFYDPPDGDDNQMAWSHDFPLGSLRRARAALNTGESDAG